MFTRARVLGDLSLPRLSVWTDNGPITAMTISGIDSICFHLSDHLDKGAVAKKSMHIVEVQHIAMYTGMET